MIRGLYKKLMTQNRIMSPGIKIYEISNKDIYSSELLLKSGGIRIFAGKGRIFYGLDNMWGIPIPALIPGTASCIR